MYFPVFINTMFVDKNGFLTPDMQSYMDLQNQALQNGLSNNGWTLPQVTAAQLVAVQPVMPDGTMWYETDAHEFVIKINGALRKVTTTPYP